MTLDKIYLDKFGQSIEGYIPEGCSLVTEYIRKDALLEWAKKELETAELTDFDEFSRGEVISWKHVLNKLNSM